MSLGEWDCELCIVFVCECEGYLKEGFVFVFLLVLECETL